MQVELHSSPSTVVRNDLLFGNSMFRIKNLDGATFYPFLGGPLSQWFPAAFYFNGNLYGDAETFMMARKAALMGD